MCGYIHRMCVIILHKTLKLLNASRKPCALGAAPLLCSWHHNVGPLAFYCMQLPGINI